MMQLQMQQQAEESRRREQALERRREDEREENRRERDADNRHRDEQLRLAQEVADVRIAALLAQQTAGVAQTTTALTELSDHNCVEVVSKLIESNLVDLVYSIDGKEYITKEYLATQIKNECLGNKGRVSLVELQQTINVEFDRIKITVEDIVRNEDSFVLSVGELIAKEYLDWMCTEVSARLADEGRLTMSAITRMIDLPSELVQAHVGAQLGVSIDAFADTDDPSVIYTRHFVDRQRRVIRGALSAVTRVVPVRQLISDLAAAGGGGVVEPGMFFRCVDQLLAGGEVRGRLVGGRNVDRALYVPEVYERMMHAYARDFYADNGYVDFASLKKLGVTEDVASFLSRVLPSTDGMLVLSGCALSADAWQQTCTRVADTLRERHWCDVQALVQPEHAADELTERVMLEHDDAAAWTRLGDTTLLYRRSLADDVRGLFDAPINQKVEQESPHVSRMLRELHRAQEQGQGGDASADTTQQPSARGKKGGGGKNKRNKGGGGASSDAKQAVAQPRQQLTFEFMSEDEIVAAIRAEAAFESCPEEILSEVAEHLRTELNATYRRRLESVFLTTQSDASAQQKRAHADFQAAMKKLHQSVCLFDQGCLVFDDLLATQLRQHLLRTLCTDAANLSLCFASGTMPPPTTLTPKARDAMVQALTAATARQAFAGLYAALHKETLDDFFDALDVVSGADVCALQLRPPDRKARLDLTDEYAGELRSALTALDASSSNVASVLLLTAVLLLLARDCRTAVHASGKFVPQLVAHYAANAPPTPADAEVEEADAQQPLVPLLLQVQQLVMKCLKKSSTDADDTNTLTDKCQQLKSVILNRPL